MSVLARSSGQTQPPHGNGNELLSRDQPSIADDSKLTNQLFMMPPPRSPCSHRRYFLPSVDDHAVAAENMMLCGGCSKYLLALSIGQGWPVLADPLYGQEILR